MTTDVRDLPGLTPAAEAPAPRPVTSVEVPASRFPRVNLLPESVRARARLRRARLILIGVSGVAAILVAALFAAAMLDVSSAESDYDMAVARGESLAREATKYAEVPLVLAELKAAEQQRAEAMAGEVRWSMVMANLSSVMPPGVALTSFKGSLTAPQAAPGTAKPATPATPAAAGAGSVDFSGDAETFPAVARWLDVLAAQKIYESPYATTIQRPAGSAADAPPLTFVSSASLSDAALSRRYQQQAGS